MPADRGSSVLTIDELAEYLKISKSTLYKLAQEGSIPSQKVGKHWRFHKDAVDEWLRFKAGESPVSLWLKGILGIFWFYVSYVVRFAVNLLLEPQINPIKHFPVVTVSHKLLLPTIPHFGKALAETAGSWADIDTEALIADIYRAREEGSRPVDRP